MHLGPYSGRSPEIIQKLRGVMTNPNCEYGANFVAIHSLAAWSKVCKEGPQLYRVRGGGRTVMPSASILCVHPVLVPYRIRILSTA